MTFIMIGELYAMFAVIIFSLIMTMGVGYGLFNFFLFIKSWLYDRDVIYFYPNFFECLPIFSECISSYRFESGDVARISLGVSFIYAFIIGVGWHILLLCGSVYLPLYALRGFIRFKTKVNKAMENTDKEGHTHEY